jgi:hypothetical protein
MWRVPVPVYSLTLNGYGHPKQMSTEEKLITPAPLADAELTELVDMEQQATPAPWTHWTGSGKIFYGEAETNKPGNYSPANLQLFAAEDYDREELDTEVEGFNIQPGLAEDDARFVAAMRNALPGLLARLRTAEAKVGPAGILSNGDFMNRLVDLAKAYRPSAQASIVRNSHMHDLPLGEESVPDQSQIDAVLTNFLNHVGVSRGMNLGLYSSDLATVKGDQPSG